MDPYGSVWSLRTPWGLPGASWGFGESKKGVKGFSPPVGAWEASLLALRGLIGCLLAYVAAY